MPPPPPPALHQLCYVTALFLLISAFNSEASHSQSQSQSQSQSHPQQSIYEALRSHGLPAGLFPKGVTNFGIDESGRFTVYLDQACNAKFESELHYDRNVSGSLSYGQIAALTGISAQELFLWFPVKGIHVDVPSSGLIHFDVGVVYKQFSLSLFETPPECMAVGSDGYGRPDLVDGSFLAESKSRNGKLRYQLDQADLGNAVW